MKKAAPKDRLPSIHFRITAEEYRHLQSVAKTMERPVSYLVAQIIRDWINKPKEPPKTE